MHLTSLYLPDILLSLLALSIELAGVAVLPERHAFPAFPQLPRASGWTRWKRRSSSAGLQLAGASRAFLVKLRHRALPRRR
jgi:chloramphenicol 3-O-phosphotransferase